MDNLVLYNIDSELYISQIFMFAIMPLLIGTLLAIYSLLRNKSYIQEYNIEKEKLGIHIFITILNALKKEEDSPKNRELEAYLKSKVVLESYLKKSIVLANTKGNGLINRISKRNKALELHEIEIISLIYLDFTPKEISMLFVPNSESFIYKAIAKIKLKLDNTSNIKEYLKENSDLKTIPFYKLLE